MSFFLHYFCPEPKAKSIHDENWSDDLNFQVKCKLLLQNKIFSNQANVDFYLLQQHHIILIQFHLQHASQLPYIFQYIIHLFSLLRIQNKEEAKYLSFTKKKSASAQIIRNENSE